MNYELAKELKDAGFPQDGDGYELHTPDCKGWEVLSNCTNKTRAIVPTLSELIAAVALPLAYFSLEQHSNDWRAGFISGAFNERLGLISYRSGSSPEEAVAHLWLALNKK